MVEGVISSAVIRHIRDCDQETLNRLIKKTASVLKAEVWAPDADPAEEFSRLQHVIHNTKQQSVSSLRFAAQMSFAQSYDFPQDS